MQYDRSREYALEVQQLIAEMTRPSEPPSDPRIDKVLRRQGGQSQRSYLRHRLYWAASFACAAGALDPVETRAIFDGISAHPDFEAAPYPPFLEPIAEGIDWLYERLFIQGIQQSKRFDYHSDFLPVDRYIFTLMLDMGAHPEVVAESVPDYCLTRQAARLLRSTSGDFVWKTKTEIFNEEHVYFEYTKLVAGRFPYQPTEGSGLEGFLQTVKEGDRDSGRSHRAGKQNGFLVFPHEAPGSMSNGGAQVVYKIRAVGAKLITLKPRAILYDARQQRTSSAFPKAIYVPPKFDRLQNPNQLTTLLDFYESQISLLQRKDLVKGGYTLHGIRGGRLLLSIAATALLGRVLAAPSATPTADFTGLFVRQAMMNPLGDHKFGDWR